MLRRICTVTLAPVVAAGFFFSSVALAQGKGDGIGMPVFTSVPTNGSPQHIPTTIPFWSGSFVYGGASYTYNMVGTDPASGSATTNIPVVLIPVRMVFSNNVTLDGSSKAAAVIASPLFQAATFKSGTTQFGDAIQRANFWNYVGTQVAPNWHVLLDQPTMAATQTIVVPQNQGVEVTGSVSGSPIGLVEYSWFNAQIHNLVVSMQIDPRSLPIFLTYNSFLYQKTVANCCIIGYHAAPASVNGNGSQKINTYIWGSYNDPGIFSVPIEDINTLSHETSEWLNDPFANNIVPAWSVPSEPQYGCSNLLETGDPLVGVAFAVTLKGVTYHPQDEAFLPWFARETPSTSFGGLYTYLGTFSTFSAGCN